MYRLRYHRPLVKVPIGRGVPVSVNQKVFQAGRTLIELMIAIAISSMIVLGITAIYSASSQSTKVATQQGALSEDGALGMHLIGQAIKRAGFGEIVGTDFIPNNQTLFPFAALRACKSARFVDPSTGNFDCIQTANAPDSLAIQFQSDSLAATSQRVMLNCLGRPPVNQQITDTDHPGYLLEIPVVSNVYQITEGNLTCAGNAANAEVLVQQIEEFKVFFGFDEAAANAALAGQTSIAPVAARIVDPDFVRTQDAALAGRDQTAWDYVVSVHLCMVARTKERGTSVNQVNTFEG